MPISDVKAKLVDKYKWSDYAQQTKERIKEISILVIFLQTGSE